MTTNIKPRHYLKPRPIQNSRKLKLIIDDFINTYQEYTSPVIEKDSYFRPEMQLEVLGIPKAKKVRFVTFKVTNREKSRVESSALDFYREI